MAHHQIDRAGRGHGLCVQAAARPGLPHSVLNTLLYLDYDREGFEIPVVPFAVNCYGSKVISTGAAFCLTRRTASSWSRTRPALPSSVVCRWERPRPEPPGKPLARGVGGVVKLVSCLPDREESLPLAGPRVRPGHVRVPPSRRLRRLGPGLHIPDRSRWTAGTSETGPVCSAPWPSWTENRRSSTISRPTYSTPTSAWPCSGLSARRAGFLYPCL